MLTEGNAIAVTYQNCVFLFLPSGKVDIIHPPVGLDAYPFWFSQLLRVSYATDSYLLFS